MTAKISALEWEASLMALGRRSERRAWRVAVIGVALAVASTAVLVATLPLRRTVPYVISVDRITGESEVMPLSIDMATSQRAIQAKYWVTEYVRARESYDVNWLDTDFVRVHRWSAPSTITDYEARFAGPQALQKILGAHAIYRVSIISVGLLDAAHADVRFERRLETGNSPPQVDRFHASLAFELKPPLFARERDLIENPLGFHVTSYRLDPELIDEKEKP